MDHIAYQVVQPGSNFSLNCTMASNFTTINKIEWQFPHKNEPFWANFELNKEIDEEFFIPQPYKPITLRTLQKVGSSARSTIIKKQCAIRPICSDLCSYSAFILV